MPGRTRPARKTAAAQVSRTRCTFITKLFVNSRSRYPYMAFRFFRHSLPVISQGDRIGKEIGVVADPGVIGATKAEDGIITETDPQIVGTGFPADAAETILFRFAERIPE